VRSRLPISRSRCLLTGYTDLLKQESLSAQTRKIAEVRVATLKLRGQAKAEFIAAKEEQRLAADRQKALLGGARGDSAADQRKGK